MAQDCIFCKLIKGEIPSIKVYEDENVLAFRDIKPEAPVHVLVAPKHHIESLEALSEENIDVVVDIHKAIKIVAEKLGINEDGYRIVINCGENGGQTVPHLHYHVLGGTKLKITLL